VTERERLLRRRELLQLRLQRNTQARTFRALAPRLRAAGIRDFSRMPPAQCQACVAPLASLPGHDERFYWREIPGSSCETWTSDDEIESLFQRALPTNASGRLAFVFHPFASGLSIATGDAARALAIVLPELHDSLWIVPRRGAGWLIEVDPGDREICWIDPLPP